MRYCDDQLWMEGREEVCRAFLDALPAERRAQWDALLFTVENGRGERIPRDDALYLAGRKGSWLAYIPMSIALVEELSQQPAGAAAIEQRLAAALEAR